jgi:hypothetical protein
MPKKYYRIELGGGMEIQVLFETAGGWVINFVVKLIMVFGGMHYEVVRYDSAHDCPHKDILDIDRSVKRKVWFELLDNKQALDLAIKDLKDNHELYVERFLRWLKK